MKIADSMLTPVLLPVMCRLPESTQPEPGSSRSRSRRAHPPRRRSTAQHHHLTHSRPNLGNSRPPTAPPSQIPLDRSPYRLLQRELDLGQDSPTVGRETDIPPPEDQIIDDPPHIQRRIEPKSLSLHPSINIANSVHRAALQFSRPPQSGLVLRRRRTPRRPPALAFHLAAAALPHASSTEPQPTSAQLLHSWH